MNLALSFNDFIFESFGGDRLDFCLAVLHEYMKVGKGMADLPEDIQLCIKSNGQTDLSRALDSIHDQYFKNGNSFEGIANPVGKIDQADQIASFSNRFESMPSSSSDLPKSKEAADPEQMEFLSTILLGYAKSIQYTIVPEEDTGTNQLVIAGRGATINKLFDDLLELLGDERLTYLGGEDYYSEIVAYLNDTEVEILQNYLDGLDGDLAL
jgi:hypothetical protein